MKTVFSIFSIVSTFLLFTTAVIASECEEDTSYPDERTCGDFYDCVDGKLEKRNCPRGTFFSVDPDLQVCVPYSESDCDFNGEKAKRMLKGKNPKVYLTFDDGPGIGSKQVLDVLKANSVQATFFLTGALLHDKVGETFALMNKKLLKRMYEEGHALGDHSLDHMKHNSPSSTWAYKNVKKDLDYFGKGNSGSIRVALIKVLGYSAKEASRIVTNMRSIARMPYTNNWRVKMAASNVITFNCIECSIPRESGENGIKIADALFNRGTNVFGWDQEWAANYLENGLGNSVSAQTMLANLEDGTDTMAPGKIVILTHDVHWAGEPQAKMLDQFIKMAKQAGYQFRKLDQFPTDL